MSDGKRHSWISALLFTMMECVIGGFQHINSLLISKKIDRNLIHHSIQHPTMTSNTIEQVLMPIPSIPPPSYEEVERMKTNEKNFYDLPKDIREVIWSIKNKPLEKKLLTLKRQNDWNKGLLMWEWDRAVKDHHYQRNLDRRGGLKPSQDILCPIGEKGSSTTWLEDRSKQEKYDRREHMESEYYCLMCCGEMICN